MWLLVLLVAVSVVVTVVARRRHADEHDSVDAQQRRLDALRTAVGQHDDPSDLGAPGGGGTGLATMRRSRDRTSRRSMLGTALIAVAVVIAAVSIYALAAGWDSSSRAADGDTGTADRSTASSSTTTSSTSSTTTTTKPAVATVLSSENGNVA